jgi:hypothetical protein
MPGDSGQRAGFRVRKKMPSRSHGGLPPSTPLSCGTGSATAPAHAGTETILDGVASSASPTEGGSPKPRAESAHRPNKLETALSKLNEAAAKLRRMLPEDNQPQMESIQACADLSTLAESLASVMETIMDERNIEESSKPAKTPIQSWVKKALPFIEQGLSAATVLFKMPSSLIVIECNSRSIWKASAVLFIVQVHLLRSLF